MKYISEGKLLQVLQGLDGNSATFVSFTARTKPRLNKRGNPFVNVEKVSTVNGILNFSYSNSVNNQLAREGKEKDFVANPRAYGVKADEHNGCLLYGAGETKLIVKVESTKDKPKYFADGTEIDVDKLRPFMPPKRTAVNQGVEDEVTYRNYNLSTIQSINLAGEQYTITR